MASSLHPELPQYNSCVHERLTGDLDVELLVACLNRALRRNDALRLRFDEDAGVPYQWVAADAPAVRVVDLSAEPDPRAACLAWIADAFDRPFPLRGAPLAEVAVLRESGSACHVYLGAHHLVLDGWSMHLFVEQVRADYAHVLRTASPLDADAPSYLDFAERAANGAHDGGPDGAPDLGPGEGELRACVDALAGVTPAVFTRRAPSGARRTTGHHFTIDRAVVDRIHERGHTAFAVVAAAFAAYLARIHRADEVVLGVPLLNRRTDDERRTVGQFANALPLRLAVSPERSMSELISDVRAGARALRSYERVPLGDVLRELPRAADAPRHVFDVTVSSLRWPAPQGIPGVRHETVTHGHAHDSDVLAVVVNELDATGPVVVDLDYACDVYDEDFPIDALAGHIDALVRGALDRPDEPLATLPMLTPAERERLTTGLNPPPTGYRAGATLQGLFAEQVARTPERSAVVGYGGALTYAELDARAEQVAAALRADGVGPDDRVAVLAGRGPHLLTAILGVLKAGGAYVPLDPGYPAERVRFLLADSGAKVVLVSGDTAGAAAAELADSIGGIAVRHIDVLASGGTGGTNGPAGPGASGRDLAYVIYTSGSTGTPKGVLVEHHSVVNRLAWMQDRYPLTADDVLLQKTPVSFDVSVWELFWWAITGARVALPRPGAEKDPRELLDAISAHGVTVVHFVPSMLGPFLDLLDRSPALRELAGSLRLVFCSGEELPAARVDQFNRIFGAAGDGPRLVNLYGPTEATVDVSYFDCPSDPARTVRRVPIGRPIHNTRLYVLGTTGEPQPAGVPGELCIAGAGVARGYLDRPELTAEKFVDDPFSPGGRMYRTGDLARWLADGTLEYLGRIDGQVKVRGNRVELGEVRAALAACPGVDDAVVVDGTAVDRTSDTRGTYLVGYYVAGAELEPAALRTALAARLPEFMVPSLFARIDRVPLTPNGKLDRAALPAPHLPAGAADQAPRTAVEASLAEIWAGVLDRPSVGVDQNWFTIGGDSILMLRVRAEAERRGLHFALADMVQNPTVAALATRVADAPAAGAATRLEPFELVSGIDRAKLAGVEDAYPVTYLHLGLLYHSSEHEVTAVYHDVFRYRVRMPWHADAFRTAFDLLVARHPVLRSSYDLGRFSEPLQLVHPAVESGLEVADLRGLDDDAAAAEIDAHIEQRRFHHYEVDRAPLYLIRAHVLADAVDLVFSFHHVIIDGWSVATLISELLQDYLHLAGLPIDAVPARELPSAAAYVLAEHAAVQSAETRRYWQRKLDGAELVQLDGFRQYEPPGDESLIVRKVPLPDGLDELVRQFAAEHALPVKSVLFAAHCLTLRLFSGQDDVTTGLVTHGRPEHADAERITGLFLNTMPLRVGPSPRTWLDMVREVYRQEQETHPHRRFPLPAVQESLGGNAVLETVFNYVHMHVLSPVFRLPGVELEEFDTWEETNFKLLVNAIVSPIDGHISLRVDTDGRTFTPDQTDLVIAAYLDILRRVVTDPDGALDFAFLAEPPAEMPPYLEQPSDVVRRLERHVDRTPDAIAVALDDTSWTYAEFDRVANRVAHRLIGIGAGPGVCVGIALERSPELIATIYGIAKSGAACVPLDVNYPAERIAAMVEQAGPLRVVVHERHAELIGDPALRLPIESVLADTTVPDGRAGLPRLTPDGLLYVLFTSGSTGAPKGVAMPHRALDNYQAWQIRAASGAAGGRTLQFAPLSFDVSFQEIYSTISGGGTLQLISEERRRDMPELLRMLDRERVERVFLPYVALQQLAETADALGIVPRDLRVVISSGEQLRITAEIRRFMAALPAGAVLENQYGPTETHLVTAYAMSGDPSRFPNLPPIGTATNGVELYLLDDRMRPVPRGVIGELYFGGIQLAHGYHGQPELTDSRFIPNPFGPPGSRLYRTGDLARVLPGGDLIWVARTDTQTKIRGYRVEPLEVELAIMKLAEHHPGIKEAAVVARRREGVDSFLAAFLTGDPAAVDLTDVKKRLRAALPDYMVPSHFTWLPAMPLTPSGKRNDAELRRLPLTANATADGTAGAAEPRDEYERALVEVLAELLHLPSVGVHDNFFDIGGTSLTAMRLVVVIEKRYRVAVPLSAFITTPTVAGLADLLRTGGATLASDPLVPIRAVRPDSADRPPLFLVHPLGGNVLCYARLARHLPADQPVYALQAVGADAGTEPIGSVPELAASYLDAIRRVQPHGPYSIGGWSFGGLVAFEMASRLRQADPASVAHLLLFDPIALRADQRAMVADSDLLEWFFWELLWLERSGHAPVEAIPADLTDDAAKFDFIARRATAAGVLRPGSSGATVRRLFRVFKANWAALIDYQPPVVGNDLTLFRASAQLPAVLRPMHAAAGSQYLDPLNGWGELTTGRVHVIDVPGDHLVLMEEPYVADIAAIVTGLLGPAATQASPATSTHTNREERS